jgi:hypothetical protein
MPISFTCPVCGSTFADPDEWGNCPTCAKSIAVAASADVAAPPAQTSLVLPAWHGGPVAWILTFVAILLVAVGLQVGDPQAGPVNKSNYEKIHNGMTEREVRAILGGERGIILFHGYSGFPGLGVDGIPETKVWYGRSVLSGVGLFPRDLHSMDISIEVDFLNGRVVGKRERGL